MSYPQQRLTEHHRTMVRKEKQQIITEYRAGTSMRALAARYRVTPGWLAQLFDTWGEPRRRHGAAQALYQSQRGTERNRATVLEEREQIVTAYRAGTSLSALATRYKVTPRWLTDVFDTWGEPRRDRAAARRLRQSQHGTGAQ